MIRLAGLCRRCDVFIGQARARVLVQPEDHDLEWLGSHCWLCLRSRDEIEQEQRPSQESPRPVDLHAIRVRQLDAFRVEPRIAESIRDIASLVGEVERLRAELAGWQAEIADIRAERDAMRARLARVRAIAKRYHERESCCAYADWDELQEALAGPHTVETTDA